MILTILGVASGLLGGAPVSPAGLQSLMPRACDYVYQYWQGGWRGRSPSGARVRVLQTGCWAMALDTERIAVPHMGAISHAPDYAAAVERDIPALATLPPAALRLSMLVDGRRYRCVGADPPSNHDGPRMIEAGRWLQRSDVTGLVFRDDRGVRLPTTARLETIAWPDRLGLVLEATPARSDLVAGAGFGRVGGGWTFDGTNDISAQPSLDLDPAELTLEAWVYAADGPEATRAYPWIVCKGANEWADGAYGLALIGGAPTARLCIGGGRTNCIDLTATNEQGGRIILGREAWHQLAMTYDGAVLRIYVDGAACGRLTVGRRRSPRADGIALGRRLDGDGDGYRFRGALDEVRLYRRALSASEVGERFRRPEAHIDPAALVREWAFDPSGPALAGRPPREWRTARLEIALELNGRRHASSAELPAGSRWRTGERRSVGLAIDPASGARPTGGTVSVKATSVDGRVTLAVEADPIRGWTRVDLNSLAPSGSGHDAMDRARLTLQNTGSVPGVVRLVLAKDGASMRMAGMTQIVGLSPMFRLADGTPSGIPVQLSKNWHSQPDRDITYQGAWFHGAAFLRLPPRSRMDLEFTIAYAHWGGVPAASHAQLCLIGWGSNQEWNQSALGAWGESICYEPDQAQAECLICDVRPLMVTTRAAGRRQQWTWTGNVGGGDAFRWFDRRGRRRYPADMRTHVARIGPDQTEVTYAGRSDDGAMRHAVTVSLHRADDIVRGTYRLRLRALRPVEFSRFVIFQIGSDTYSYTGERRMAIGNGAALTREWPTQWGGGVYRTPPVRLVGAAPWVALSGCVPRDDGGGWLGLANRGFIIRSWRARIGGRPVDPWVAERGVSPGSGDTSTADLLLPPDVHRLRTGDFIDVTVEHVVVPQMAEDYYGPNAGLRDALARDQDSWRIVAREAAGNRLEVRGTVGRILSTWPVVVAAKGNCARFMVTGGVGWAALRITGLTDCRAPCLETRAPGGLWRRLDQSVHGRDFWQADYDAVSRRWAITYTVPMDGPRDPRPVREFRFQVGPGARFGD